MFTPFMGVYFQVQSNPLDVLSIVSNSIGQIKWKSVNILCTVFHT